MLCRPGNGYLADIDSPLNFLGKWYEIARYDHRFERGMDNVTAEYSLREDGKIKVVNTGWKGIRKQVALGKAKQPDPKANPGHLKVSFFLFFYSDYDILLLDEDYGFSLIGSKSSDYLWILSRKPVLQEKVLAKIFAEAERLGYDTSKLIMVDQSHNIDVA